MRKCYELFGMGFGCEGIGSFVDYFAQKEQIANIIRHGGKYHDIHKVVLENGKSFSFHQLGAAMFENDVKTYINRGMLVNPSRLIWEVEEFAKVSGQSVCKILKRIFIDENCYVITPFHELMGRMKMIIARSQPIERQDPVDEATFLIEREMVAIKIGTLMKEKALRVELEKLYQYTFDYFCQNQSDIYANLSMQEKQVFNQQMGSVIMRGAINRLYDWYRQFIQMGVSFYRNIQKEVGRDKVIIEGEYGILGLRHQNDFYSWLDYFYRKWSLYPNRYRIGILNVVMQGSQKTQLVTYDKELTKYFPSLEKSIGWLDFILLKYSQRLSKPDEIYLTGVEQIGEMEEAKVCIGYEYIGEEDEELGKVFEYEKEENRIRILALKKYDEMAIECLKKCIPIYQIIYAKTKEQRILEYIQCISQVLKCKITVISEGERREDIYQLKEA